MGHTCDSFLQDAGTCAEGKGATHTDQGVHSVFKGKSRRFARVHVPQRKFSRKCLGVFPGRSLAHVSRGRLVSLEFLLFLVRSLHWALSSPSLESFWGRTQNDPALRIRVSEWRS